MNNIYLKYYESLCNDGCNGHFGLKKGKTNQISEERVQEAAFIGIEYYSSNHYSCRTNETKFYTHHLVDIQGLPVERKDKLITVTTLAIGKKLYYIWLANGKLHSGSKVGTMMKYTLVLNLN